MVDSKQPQSRIIAIPSDRAWFDARLLNSATQIKITDFAGTGPFPMLVIPADTRRIMLGFLPDTNGGNLFEVSPWPDVNVVPFMQIQTPPTFFWMTLFDYGPIICNSWYGVGSGVATTRVVETLRV